ncbi:MAG: DUF3482 domain-containing protein [Myxococcota bacterium]
MTAPVFAVVGRVNKGKSSVIATLAEDERVAISKLPGTTRSCSEYPVKVDGQTQFTLVDTPGFEDAAAALAWLRRTDPPADQRVQRLHDFMDAFDGSEDFYEERELLRPILAGASILYVVDGTRPYRDNYDGEMEILRWTGQPSMALINRIGAGDHIEAWRRALDQYFPVVRDFDAHTASFEERVRLLATFQALVPSLEGRLERAIDALRGERERREREVARLMTDLLVDLLTFTLETNEGEQGDPKKLEEEFHAHLRALETQARRRVELLYHHAKVTWQSEELMRPVFGEDLFAARTWSVLGLSPGQLVTLYVMSGAVAGGIVDASVGGATFLTGTAVGSVVGAGAGLWHLQQRFARATSIDGVVGRMRRAFSGERTYRIGPFEHPNFPFIVLDRARLHHDAVRTRAHAKSAVDQELSGTGDTLVAGWSSHDREMLHRIFSRIRKRREDLPDETRADLSRLIEARISSSKEK